MEQVLQLVSSEGIIEPRDIAEKLKLNPDMVKDAVDGLEKLGFLERISMNNSFSCKVCSKNCKVRRGI